MAFFLFLFRLVIFDQRDFLHVAMGGVDTIHIKIFVVFSPLYSVT